MAGPIPVFSFVFAAYAATCGRKPRIAEDCDGVHPAPGSPFLTVLRANAVRGRAVFAKIRISNTPELAASALATASSGETGEDVWVGGIVQAELGFVGAVVEPGSNTRQVQLGRQIRFHVINVKDWRLGFCPEECRVRRPGCAGSDT